MSGDQELYTPDIGIRLRGITTPPIGRDSGVANWLLTGWPIGALLIVVWTAYGVAIFFMSRISAGATGSAEVSQ